MNRLGIEERKAEWSYDFAFTFENLVELGNI